MIEKLEIPNSTPFEPSILERQVFVYVAHPYGGKEENKELCAKYMKKLQNHFYRPMFISGIHTFCFYSYEDEDYEIGIDRCLLLLSKCKAIVLCGDWRNSKGCCAEYGYAMAKGIQVFELEEP